MHLFTMLLPISVWRNTISAGKYTNKQQSHTDLSGSVALKTAVKRDSNSATKLLKEASREASERTYTLLSVSDSVSASLDMLCCSLSLALVAGARA